MAPDADDLTPPPLDTPQQIIEAIRNKWITGEYGWALLPDDFKRELRRRREEEEEAKRRAIKEAKRQKHGPLSMRVLRALKSVGFLVFIYPVWHVLSLLSAVLYVLASLVDWLPAKIEGRRRLGQDSVRWSDPDQPR